ncbi:MAG TPA: metallophosphoesterase [Candidatus Aquabacterium excrementipullorum]|nr:metallophosphoesterase [Candidatus Aquabacterium excrementipullorum]
MKLQILSDLHLETERFTPEPAPGAELLVLAGDVDSTWAGLSLFKDWPVPVVYVPGNHEFDQRDIHEALAGLRQRCGELGLRMLERESCVIRGADGRHIRFVGTVRWCDFDLFGADKRAKSQRAASYFVKVMRATRNGQPFDPEAVRDEALVCRAWLADTLAQQPTPDQPWDATVAITHYGPSLRSADPRYGNQPGTASFCNADDGLLPLANLWIHGHLHCRHDYTVTHPQGGSTRVVSNARGHGYKSESLGHDGLFSVVV